MAKIQTREAAERLARAIAKDLSLYNEDKISFAAGDREKLMAALEAELDEGRELYESRVDASILELGLFDEAIEEILISPNVGGSGATTGAERPRAMPSRGPARQPAPSSRSSESSEIRSVGMIVTLIVVGILALVGVLWFVLIR